MSRRRTARRLLILGVGLALILPWLSRSEWQSTAAASLERVVEARPELADGRTLYTVMAIAADTLLPGDPALAVNLLSLAAALVTALAVARLRWRLNPSSVFLEPLVSALALMVTGLFWRQAVAADVQMPEMALTVVAACLAWGGRPVAGMACFLLALFTSASAIFNLPVLLLAIRRRQDWRPALLWLAPWLLFVVLAQPRVLPHAAATPSPGYAANLVQELGVNLLGMIGVAPLIGLGVLATWRGWAPRRRFLVATGLAALAHVVGHGHVATDGLGYVSLMPWLAVVAGGAVPALRRAGERLAGASHAPAITALCALLAVNAQVSWQHMVAPTWQHARAYSAFARQLLTAFRGARVVGTEAEMRLFRLASRDQLVETGVMEVEPWPVDSPPPAELRAGVDKLLAGGGLLLVERGLAIRLAGGEPAHTQLVKEDPATAADAKPAVVAGERQWLGRFAGGIELTDALIVPPRPRAGEIVALELDWRAGDDAALLAEPWPRVAAAVVDEAGVERLDLSHWLGLGLVPATSFVGGRILVERLIMRLPGELAPGDYAIEVALYRPRTGDRLLRDLHLGFRRGEWRPVVASETPRGVTPASLRAATLRVQP